MKTNEQVVQLMRGKQFDSARYAAIERLKHDCRDVQAWVFLGQALIGLNCGRMANLCFLRALLFEPFASWAQAMEREISLTLPGADDTEVLHVLQTPHSSVSAVVLTRNSQRTIARCIESLSEAVHEIIVVDTGSTDRTIDIVTSSGIPVHHFEWCDDFSAARNFGLSLATSDWVISVDSDEYLHPDDRASIKTLAGLYHDSALSIRAIILDSHTQDSQPLVVPRMFTSRHFEWVNPIHEQVTQKTAGTYYEFTARIRLLHDGYDSSVVDLDKKLQRNIRILRSAIEKNPEHAGYQFFLGRDLSNAGCHKEAILYLETAYQLGSKDPSFVPLPDVATALYHAHKALNQLDRAKGALTRLTKDRPEYPDGWFYCGLEAVQDDTQSASRFFKNAINASQSYRGPAAFDHEIGLWKANYMLGVLAQQSGNAAEAIERFRQVLRVNPNVVDAAQRLQQLGAG